MMTVFDLPLQVPTSQKKEGVYDVPKSQPVSVSIFPVYMQLRWYVAHLLWCTQFLYHMGYFL